MRSFSVPMSILLTLLIMASTLIAQPADPALEEETVARLREYLKVDTINPPGNEIRAVEFFARLLEKEGIPYETAESAPGRGNIWARLSGGDEPALILLNHTDVVPADPDHWITDPLSAEIIDEMIYGRGALDMKGLAILHFQAFLALHRSGRKLNRDVIFMATADEEAGGFYGAGWMIEEYPELFQDVGFLLNEGGSNIRMGDDLLFSIEVTQKVPLWLRLVASDEPGHGSMPRRTSSVGRLIEALSRINRYSFPPRLVSSVENYFAGIAPVAEPALRDRFASMSESVQDSDFLTQLQIKDPYLHALTRNTCSLTGLEGSNKINVVPPEAAAEIDCRLLPDQDPDEFVALLETIINDPAIRIEKIMGFTPAVSSTETELYRAIEVTLSDRYPGSHIVPAVSAGFTDSHFFRDLGVVSYGFNPSILPEELKGAIHGNNERIPVESVRQGVRDLIAILETFVY